MRSRGFLMKVLLTGAGGPAGRALYPQLIAKGVRVTRVDMVPGIGVGQVPAARDPLFLKAISQIIASEGIDAIIPTVQEELPVFARAILPIPVLISSPDAVDTADDKWLTYHVLNRAGVATPISSTPESINTEILEIMGERVISKPRMGRGGRGVTVHENPHSWELAELPEGIIIQEFAGGVEYAPNVFISPNRTECVVLQKTELAHGIHGNAVSTEVVDDQEIADLAIKAAKTLGIFGPADVDIRRKDNGEPVVLEINARFGANSMKAPIILEAALESYRDALPHLGVNREVIV
ncbi:ATP-grasp domain-containing protein [Flaviflexus ciconiae]|uniref:ATP-grasp domain-containing protein n=2 Tax=Flaviflexus ciconiae TaxID=2496867 RepID=A0A3Q9G2L2_9ACTO|nr:ATP-grasp domain-containing protein [Flaviflexus ciconiae]